MADDRAGDTPSTAARIAIVAIKLVHSAIFLVNSAAILYLFAAGLRGRPGRWTRPALTAVAVELVSLGLSGGVCPLTRLTERLGSSDGRVSDIFLPRWLADRIPLLCTPPLVVGVTGLLLRRR